jgi:hypothetical protein
LAGDLSASLVVFGLLLWWRVTFRPRERATLFLADTGRAIHAAAAAFDADGCAYITSHTPPSAV